MSDIRRGAWSRLRGLVPRSRVLRVLLVLVPLLLVLAIVEPIVGLFAMAVGAVTAVLRPLLESPYGRLLLACAVTGATVWAGMHLFRARIQAFRASLLLRRHLDAIAALLADEPRRARRLFETVARSRAPLPTEFPQLRDDACLKLARLALRDGAPGRAQAWLLRIRDAELPPSLARSWVQMRAEVEMATPGAMPASVERVVRESLARFPDDLVLSRLLRDLHSAQGAHAEAATAQERVVRLSADPAERSRLATLWLAAAEHAWASGDDAATEAHLAAAMVADRALAEHSLLAGEVCLRRGDLRAALRTWARGPGSRGLARCARALAAGSAEMSPREVLELCPTLGGLLLAARTYADRGDHARAVRTARIAARALPESPTAAVAIVEILRRAGAPDADEFEAAARARLAGTA